jgi:cytochrome c556
MSFLSKWFKLSQRGGKNKSKKNTPRTSPISETDDDDNVFTDEDNITISSTNLYTDLFKQQAQLNTSNNDLPESYQYLNSRQAYVCHHFFILKKL